MKRSILRPPICRKNSKVFVYKWICMLWTFEQDAGNCDPSEMLLLGEAGVARSLLMAQTPTTWWWHKLATRSPHASGAPLKLTFSGTNHNSSWSVWVHIVGYVGFSSTWSGPASQSKHQWMLCQNIRFPFHFQGASMFGQTVINTDPGHAVVQNIYKNTTLLMPPQPFWETPSAFNFLFSVVSSKLDKNSVENLHNVFRGYPLVRY